MSIKTSALWPFRIHLLIVSAAAVFGSVLGVWISEKGVIYTKVQQLIFLITGRETIDNTYIILLAICGLLLWIIVLLLMRQILRLNPGRFLGSKTYALAIVGLAFVTAVTLFMALGFSLLAYTEYRISMIFS